MVRSLVNGTRRQVWNRTRVKTPSGLRRKDLKMNKQGRIVSKKRSMRAKREKRLVKAGYIPKKGTFTLFRKHKPDKTKRRNKRSSQR